MAENVNRGAISDSSGTDGAKTDLNGAQTAVGVPHPENRLDGQSVPAVDLSGFEQDDYDDDKQDASDVAVMPPDQDAGESFREIVDVGEAPHMHQKRTDLGRNPDQAPMNTPTVDNQTNQPERFHNDKGQDAGTRRQ